MPDHILSMPFNEWCNREFLKAHGRDDCPGKNFMRPDTEAVSEEDRANTRARVGSQAREIGLDAAVTCQCGKKIPVIRSYRCWYCGVYFCERCAREHFNVPEGFFRGDPALRPDLEAHHAS